MGQEGRLDRPKVAPPIVVPGASTPHTDRSKSESGKAQRASVEKLVHQLRRKIGRDKLVAFVSGNFNILHPGHLRLLKFAADNSDVLVVGVNADGTHGVTVPAAMRLEALRSITMVDHAILLDEPPHDFIAKLRPEIVVKGKEYEHHDNAERAVVDSYGGKLLFTSGEVRFASINLLRRDYFDTNFSVLRKSADFPARHGFEIHELKNVLTSFAGIRVLVIGDLIIDTYVDCAPLGMSREDPTIVVSPLDQQTFVGGAGIVAAHARGLGAEVHFLTVGGHDEQVGFARSELEKIGVPSDLLVDETRPTTNKIRYRAQGKTLLRLNNLRQHAIDQKLVSAMMKRVEALLPNVDLLLFSDFNYGCLPQVLVDSVIPRAKMYGVMLAADSQASSQHADISRF
jgi:cytidyltransferase-like protein